MEIFESTEYVPEREYPWYKLEVINQWDWSTKPVCYRDIHGNLINYRLTLNTVSSEKYWKSENVEELTDEIKSELKRMGYSLKKGD